MVISSPVRARIFGPLVTYPNGHKGTDPANLQTVTTPWGLKVRLHRMIVPVYLAAAEKAERTCTWRPKRIDSFAPRPIRGSTTAISLHALGLATDSFATPPNVVPPGGVWTPINGVPPEFARCFTDVGFRWGATFDRVDVPHIEWPQGPPGQIDPAPPPAPHPPTSRGGTVVRFHPTVAGQIDYFWTAPRGNVLHRYVTGWPFSPEHVGPEDLGGVIVRDLDGDWRPDGSALVLSGVGQDQALHENVWTPANGWSGWKAVGG